MSEEANLISQLLEIEEEADALVREAQKESESVVAAARAQADAEYSQKFFEISEGLEKEFKERICEIDREREKNLASYKEEVEKTQKNFVAFEKYLNEVLQG